MDLEELARAALDDAGGRLTPVPGAKVANSMAAIASREDFDYRAAMRSLGLSVKSLLRRLEDARILDRDRGDFRVAFVDAAESIATEPKRPTLSGPRYIRKDVFDAFTRMTDQGYRYVLDRDVFVAPASAPASSVIPVPPPSLELLIEMRLSFIATIRGENSPVADRLGESLKNDKPLASFSKLLADTEFENRWRDYQSERLRPRVLEWAAQNSVVAREAWFESSPRRNLLNVQPAEHVERSILRAAIDRLTDDELRNITVPLRLIERLMQSP